MKEWRVEKERGVRVKEWRVEKERGVRVKEWRVEGKERRTRVERVRGIKYNDSSKLR